ncbi:hypothetical protein [Spirosoma daeguense]
MQKTLFLIAACLILLTVQANNLSVTEPLTDNKPEKTVFYSNPLLLNGKLLNYETFWLYSQGTLALVSGNPESEEAVNVPFKIYLNRNGTFIQKGASDSERIVYSVDVATVLALAKSGDELIIEPARKTDWQARRRIVIRNYSWPFPQNWLIQKRGDGC